MQIIYPSHRQSMKKFTFINLLIFCLLACSGNSFASRANRAVIENNDFRLRLIPRTPNQIAAFYEARGFPRYAIEELRKVCFITVGLKNKSKKILWLDLSNWHFKNSAGQVRRYLRQDWKDRWNKTGLEKRFQSTFRWTLMPEKLDFRPHEAEGGNIILPRDNRPITIKAMLYIGKNKQKPHPVEFSNIRCANDEGR